MRLSSRGWLAIHLGTLVVAFAILFVLNIHAWFIGDEWDMIVRATQPLTIHALFAPHNEHWSTVPILIYRILVDLFGLRTYVPYLCVLFAAHLCLAHLLWRLMRQVGASDACATALAAIFAVLGAGAQNLTNAFQVSFVISVTVGIGAVLLVNVESLKSAQRQTGVVALMLLGLMSSNVGITMTVFVGLVVFFRHGFRLAMWLVAIPALAYIVWFITFGFSSLSTDRITIATVLALPAYVWMGFTSSMTRFTGVTESGGAIVVGILGYATWKSAAASTRESPAFAGVLSVIVLFLSAGLVRTFLGTSQATATRYAYIAIALLLPIFALGIMDLRNRAGGHFGLILGTVVVVLIAGSNLAQLRAFALLLRPLEQTSQEEVFAAAILVRDHAPITQPAPAKQLNPYVDEAALRAIVQAGLLPHSLRADEGAQLNAEMTWQTAATATALTPTKSDAIRVVTVDGSPATPGANGCLSASKPGGATVYVSTAAPTALDVLPSSGTSIEIQLRAGRPNATVGVPTSFPISPTRQTYIDLLGKTMNVTLTFSNSKFQLCGL